MADTSGTTIWATYTPAFAVWTFTNFKTDLYTIVHVDSVSGETLLAEGYRLDGAVLGDGQIDRAAVFGDSVIPPSALNPDSTYGFTRLAADSVAAKDSTLIAITSPIRVPKIAVDSLGAADSASITITSPAVCDSPLTVGAYTLPVADGTAADVLTTDGSGTVSWVSPGTNFPDSLDALLPLRILSGTRLMPMVEGMDSVYVAGLDSGDVVLASWAPGDGQVPFCMGAGSRPMSIGAICTVADTFYAYPGCSGGVGYAGGDSCYHWIAIDID